MCIRDSIHERHVFDCENKHGEVAPQQEKALEALGFELPDPDTVSYTHLDVYKRQTILLIFQKMMSVSWLLKINQR